MLDKLHDSNLLAIIISETDSKQITIRFKSVESIIYEVILNRVEHFRCNDFLQGNIVFEISISKGIIVDKEELLWIWNNKQKPQYIEKMIEKINNGELTFLEVGSSYGAKIVAIAEKIHANFI